jgi:hypothetical protein
MKTLMFSNQQLTAMSPKTPPRASMQIFIPRDRVS